MPRQIVTIAMVRNAAAANFAQWLGDRRNSRVIPHRMERCDYVAVRDDGVKLSPRVINGGVEAGVDPARTRRLVGSIASPQARLRSEPQATARRSIGI